MEQKIDVKQKQNQFRANTFGHPIPFYLISLSIHHLECEQKPCIITGHKNKPTHLVREEESVSEWFFLDF